MTKSNSVNIPNIITTKSDSGSVISNEISPEQQVGLLSIQRSTTTTAAAAVRQDTFTTSKTNLEEEEDFNTTIPLVEHEQHYTKNTKIKQGLVICTRTEEWYTKKKSTMREVQLRKTRLRWRQFKAILKPDKIELYHVTNIIVTTAQRLAHVIYLNNQFPYRKVKLSLVSAQDYIWSLEFLHYETKSLIAYHFQSNSLHEAQDWYMSIYQILPNTILCKNPIPPIIDIFIMLKREEQQPLSIRIPLDMILKDNNNNNNNIKISDIKPVIWNLFKKKGLLNLLGNHQQDQLRLCWRSVDSIKRCGEGAAAATKSTAISCSTPVHGEFIEWIDENSELIGPQLIEQKHRLELRSSRMDEASNKTNELKNKSGMFDGLLINKCWHSTPDIHRKHKKCKKTYFYAILYGHQLFFLEKSYYYYYKRLRDHEIQQQQQQQHHQFNNNEIINTSKKNNSWFSATTGGIYLRQQKNKLINNNNKMKKKNWQHINHSTPNLSPSNTAIEAITPMADTIPDPIVLSNTRFIIDLNRVSNVQPQSQQQTDDNNSCLKTFEIHLKDLSDILYYEAPSTQTMLDWVTLIKSKIKIDPQLLLGHYNGFETYQSRPEHVKDILQSGILYVKQDYKRSFQPQYCVLSKNEFGSTLMMFDTLKNKKQWWLHFDCFSGDNNQERKQLPIYEKKRQLIQLENTFVYTGDACILDKLVSQAAKVEPLRYYQDGAITGGNTTSECVFVIWQLSKKHFIPNFREYVSLFKLGHHLGNRGSSWVFKARSRQERDEWVWALHKEFGVLKL